MLESAGLKPMSIDIIPCALFRNFERSFRRQEDRENAIIFVDVGSFYTTVIFGRGGEISFVKQIKIGAGDFDSEVASKLGISNREAEVLREELNAENHITAHEKKQRIDASTRQVMVNAISKIAEKLASEISRCLRYYTVTFRGKHIERAVFTGVGSHENILLDIMRRQLTVEIEIAEPFRGFDLSNEKINMMDYRGLLCEWAIAVGLSLKGWNGIKNQKYEAQYSS
jgi:Tfp pilus assembly PilM family ATPase